MSDQTGEEEEETQSRADGERSSPSSIPPGGDYRGGGLLAGLPRPRDETPSPLSRSLGRPGAAFTDDIETTKPTESGHVELAAVEESAPRPSESAEGPEPAEAAPDVAPMHVAAKRFHDEVALDPATPASGWVLWVAIAAIAVIAFLVMR